jgi:hypothetical protein
MLLMAAQVYGDDALLQRAKEIAIKVIWPRGLLRKGVGLCHGIAGNAYALLMLSQHDSSSSSSGDASFLTMAQSFAVFAEEHLNELKDVADRPYSLYEGLAGLGALFLDLADPVHVGFPLYY